MKKSLAVLLPVALAWSPFAPIAWAQHVSPSTGSVGGKVVKPGTASIGGTKPRTPGAASIGGSIIPRPNIPHPPTIASTHPGPTPVGLASTMLKK